MRRKKPSAIEPHLAAETVAKLLDCTSDHLRRMRMRGKGPRWVVTTDKTIRYPESGVREYLGAEEAA